MEITTLGKEKILVFLEDIPICQGNYKYNKGKYRYFHEY